MPETSSQASKIFYALGGAAAAAGILYGINRWKKSKAYRRNPVFTDRTSDETEPYDIIEHPNLGELDSGQVMRDWRLTWELVRNIYRAPTLEQAEDNLADEPERMEGILQWLGDDPIGAMVEAPIIVGGDGVIDGWHRMCCWLLLGLADTPIPVVFAQDA